MSADGECVALRTRSLCAFSSAVLRFPTITSALTACICASPGPRQAKRPVPSRCQVHSTAASMLTQGLYTQIPACAMRVNARVAACHPPVPLLPFSTLRVCTWQGCARPYACLLPCLCGVCAGASAAPGAPWAREEGVPLGLEWLHASHSMSGSEPQTVGRYWPRGVVPCLVAVMRTGVLNGRVFGASLAAVSRCISCVSGADSGSVVRVLQS